ncbi:MAG: single-stranded-DNA-specific exonuclease RecJ [Candidatus Gastranaerophilaceae bacterium]
MKSWKCPKLTGTLSVASKNPLLAKLLLARNIDTDEKVDEFLHPESVPFIPLSVFNKSEIVISRIQEAVEKQKKIIVYGDFDTDGVTSTAILFKTLSKIGANVGYYLPDRDSESHGLNSKAIINLISKQKAKLIITVDCGVSNVKEVRLAKTFNTDIIITDHHEAPSELPEALAIINPKASSVLNENLSAKDIESLCSLSGAGIAFKLSSEILLRYNLSEFIKELIPIAALGTIGDIVPLVYENRHIAYSGIKAVQGAVNKGITKLLQNAGVKDFEKITSETIAFTVVPRINATGRLGSADKAFKLLVSDNDEEIDTIAKELNDINSLRQNLCEEAFERAVQIVEITPELYKHSIVICDEKAHIGIIGLSASKLVEKYNKPAFVMRKDGNNYRCSCRGVKGVNIFEILNENKDLFLGYGGHEFAGGFSFDGEEHSFEQVQKAINDIVVEQTNGQELENILHIDAFLNPEDISFDLIDTVKLLEPFGAANPSPVFALKNLRVSDYKFMGQNQNHLKLFCSSENNKTFECIKWSVSTFDGDKGEEINIAFTPEKNCFNGKESIQLLLKDMQLPEVITQQNSLKLIDCRSQKGGYDKIVDFLEHTKKKVGIFTENKEIHQYFSKYEISKEKLFTRDFVPKNTDMCICIDFPPSIDFLQNLVSNNTKEILLMKYEQINLDTKGFLSKIAGMLRYTLSSLNGETTLKAMRSALYCSDDILLKAILVLQKAKIVNGEIDKNGNIDVSSIHSTGIFQINEMLEFKEFNSAFNEYKIYNNTINNAPIQEIKKLILK